MSTTRGNLYRFFFTGKSRQASRMPLSTGCRLNAWACRRHRALPQGSQRGTTARATATAKAEASEGEAVSCCAPTLQRTPTPQARPRLRRPAFCGSCGLPPCARARAWASQTPSSLRCLASSQRHMAPLSQGVCCKSAAFAASSMTCCGMVLSGGCGKHAQAGACARACAQH
jgi:hypothetical protein